MDIQCDGRRKAVSAELVEDAMLVEQAEVTDLLCGRRIDVKARQDGGHRQEDLPDLSHRHEAQYPPCLLFYADAFKHNTTSIAFPTSDNPCGIPNGLSEITEQKPMNKRQTMKLTSLPGTKITVRITSPSSLSATPAAPLAISSMRSCCRARSTWISARRLPLICTVIVISSDCSQSESAFGQRW